MEMAGRGCELSYHPDFVGRRSSETGYVGGLTIEEAKALEELRVQVHNDGLDIDKWLLRPAETETMLLLRFLRARKFHVGKARRLLAADAAWREQHGLAGLWRWAEPAAAGFGPLEGTEGVYPQHWLQGFDRQGRPVAFHKYGHFKVWECLKFTSVENMLRHHVWCNERALRLGAQHGAARGICVETTVGVIDLAGWSPRLAHRAAWRYVRAVAAADSDHYPERLGAMLLINSPSTLTGIWKVISTWLDARTKEKIKILGGREQYLPVLLGLMDADQLPREYGGTGTRRNLAPDTAVAAAAAGGAPLPAGEAAGEGRAGGPGGWGGAVPREEGEEEEEEEQEAAALGGRRVSAPDGGRGGLLPWGGDEGPGGGGGGKGPAAAAAQGPAGAGAGAAPLRRGASTDSSSGLSGGMAELSMPGDEDGDEEEEEEEVEEEEEEGGAAAAVGSGGAPAGGGGGLGPAAAAAGEEEGEGEGGPEPLLKRGASLLHLGEGDGTFQEKLQNVPKSGKVVAATVGGALAGAIVLGPVGFWLGGIGGGAAAGAATNKEALANTFGHLMPPPASKAPAAAVFHPQQWAILVGGPAVALPAADGAEGPVPTAPLNLVRVVRPALVMSPTGGGRPRAPSLEEAGAGGGAAALPPPAAGEGAAAAAGAGAGAAGAPVPTHYVVRLREGGREGVAPAWRLRPVPSEEKKPPVPASAAPSDSSAAGGEGGGSSSGGPRQPPPGRRRRRRRHGEAEEVAAASQGVGERAAAAAHKRGRSKEKAGRRRPRQAARADSQGRRVAPRRPPAGQKGGEEGGNAAEASGTGGRRAGGVKKEVLPKKGGEQQGAAAHMVSWRNPDFLSDLEEEEVKGPRREEVAQVQVGCGGAGAGGSGVGAAAPGCLVM